MKRDRAEDFFRFFRIWGVKLYNRRKKKMGTIKIPAADVLKKIYGETEESSAR